MERSDKTSHIAQPRTLAMQFSFIHSSSVTHFILVIGVLGIELILGPLATRYLQFKRKFNSPNQRMGPGYRVCWPAMKNSNLSKEYGNIPITYTCTHTYTLRPATVPFYPCSIPLSVWRMKRREWCVGNGQRKCFLTMTDKLEGKTHICC